MSYHPPTNGQSEWAIQEVEVASRIYCGNYPDTWSTLLPQFKFAHNHSTHSVTGKSPFELLMGYQPRAIVWVHPKTKHSSTKEWLTQLQELQENAMASHTKAAAAIAKRHTAENFEFKKRDKVFLESTNFKFETLLSKPKASPKTKRTICHWRDHGTSHCQAQT